MITSKIYKILLGTLYMLMIGVNYLANALPIGGRDTGVISDSYPNLFAPIGFTFAIWGVIYSLLAIFVLREIFFQKSELPKSFYQLVLANFALNSAWIFAWHYDLIGLALVIMIALLVDLVKINNFFKVEKLKNKSDKWIKVPFAIYFGWITVACIANITVFLVSSEWGRLGASEQFWTVVVLLAGLVIGALTSYKHKSLPYLLTLIWAYLGIFAKHYLPSPNFAGQYKAVLVTVLLCELCFAYIFLRLLQEKNLQKN